MGGMSRQKGKRGEREVAEFLRSHGIPARRGQQYRGGEDSPDVIGLDGFHNEVKRTEKFRLYQALEQAADEARTGDIPVVWHRSNQRPWVVVLRAEDFLALVKANARRGVVLAGSGAGTDASIIPAPAAATTEE